MAGWPQQLPGPLVADRRVDPVPGGRGVHEVEACSRGGAPGLERALDDLDVREARKVAPGGCRQVGSDLDAGDRKPATRQGEGRLAGGAPDLQEPAGGADPGRVDERVESTSGYSGRACW